MSYQEAIHGALVKMNDRTKRRPCNKCGSLNTYWGGYQEELPSGNTVQRFVQVEADSATRPVAKGDFFPLGHLHSAVCGMPDQERKTQDTVTIPVIKPEPEAKPVVQTIDTDAIRRIVSDELAKQAPTVVVVKKDSPNGATIAKSDGPVHYALAEVLEWLLAGENVVMFGPAGTGKTTISRQCADMLGIPWGGISLNAQTPKSDLFGYRDANGTYQDTEFRRHCERKEGLFMLDEFDKGHGGIMAGLNMALANGVVPFPDQTLTLSPDLLFCAGANTDGRGPKDGYISQKQDVATYDRFSAVYVDYDEKLEAELVRMTGISASEGVKVLTAVRQCRANVAKLGITDLVYSPRASVGMARALVGGLSWGQAIKGRLRKGLTDQEWSKVGAGVVAA